MSEKTSIKFNSGSSMSCIYFLGMIGSAVYFISNATGFWQGTIGLAKSLVWPAYLTFEAFTTLGV